MLIRGVHCGEGQKFVENKDISSGFVNHFHSVYYDILAKYSVHKYKHTGCAQLDLFLTDYTQMEINDAIKSLIFKNSQWPGNIPPSLLMAN